MRVRLEQANGHLVLRIPKELAAKAQLGQGALVDLAVVNGKVVLSPVTAFTLEELLAGITPENLHGEIEAGGPVGREEW